jgi:hypothetical protein
MAEDFAAFGSREYYILLACVAFARAMDFFSTWVATPNLMLEANPIARKMGWKFGILINIVLCFLFALWPLPAIVITTTSLLVAARNFQAAWLMRSMGELNYRLWMTERISEAPRMLFFGCTFAQALLYVLLGVVLMYFASWRLVPFGIGMGMVTYAFAVSVYTSISVWRAAFRRL